MSITNKTHSLKEFFTKNIFIWIFLAYAVLSFALRLPDKHYVLYDGAVNPETGTLCVMGESSGKSVLYLYTADGDPIVKYYFQDSQYSREKFNRIWVEDDVFFFYRDDDNTIYSIDESGTILESEKLSFYNYWEQRSTWENWSVKGNTYSCKYNGVRYEYDNSNYFTLKFTQKSRELRVFNADENPKKYLELFVER